MYNYQCVFDISCQCSKWDGIRRYAVPAPLLADSKHTGTSPEEVKGSGNGSGLVTVWL